MWEAAVTFGAFWVLLIACYVADRFKASQDAKKENKDEPLVELFEYQAVDFYKTLLKDKQNGTVEDEEKSKKMK